MGIIPCEIDQLTLKESSGIENIPVLSRIRILYCSSQAIKIRCLFLYRVGLYSSTLDCTSLQMILPKSLSLLLAISVSSLASLDCKLSPAHLSWPSSDDWVALNRSIEGALTKTAPVASSCYAGNPFNSPENCTNLQDRWSYAAFHAALPESIDFPIWTNNSCLPKGVTGYTEEKGCNVGGLPQYVVNATTEKHIAVAMKWASQRNIRIVVKGTGHDLNGR